MVIALERSVAHSFLDNRATLQSKSKHNQYDVTEVSREKTTLLQNYASNQLKLFHDFWSAFKGGQNIWHYK